ncbi:HAD family hydrolase [Burkholderia stagnalis]|uniref:HAD family phosphatase n=1 Tax=Burkholderia stagnalis TaxID=1503054 RepID=A0ABX9YNE3_9BURK|nr:HAD family phosphatase [Burkholderia stagnalis]RQQ57243.1 HAD family phosphatase [Burkholderia stagnalis]RQQ66306.1 HAD family phosphatase [Burkholderia stagnalis]RQQ68346.1 HAD family phosphatase [Burkholderia stagnalis]RQQ78917.1 HAD family phosphatase [Burkholderia stagnalis]RQQ88145.1 HAD family phosphatase [Burkholderia stagnalis]
MSLPIAWVVFDMEGVLTHYDRAARVARLSVLTGRPPDAIRHAIWESGLEARADAGELTPAAYLDALGSLLACRVSRDAWLDARRASITPNAETLALAARVAERRPIAVLTNNCRLVTDHLDYLNPPVARLFGAHVFASASFGAAKPTAQAYLGCVAQLGARPDATLFIDDTDANVAGAVDAGLLGYRFVDAARLADELRGRGLI